MQSAPLVDSAGRRRSPATFASFHVGRAPRNKGLRYPPDPPAYSNSSRRIAPSCCPSKAAGRSSPRS